ncbi:unnamed protein product, partial [Prorocentrum cordatum]
MARGSVDSSVPGEAIGEATARLTRLHGRRARLAEVEERRASTLVSLDAEFADPYVDLEGAEDEGVSRKHPLRCRRSFALGWELNNQRSFYAGQAFAPASDAVWRRSFRGAGIAQGQAPATLLWDLSKFNEAICIVRLEQHCEMCGFPAPIFRLAMRAYRSARFACLAGIVTGPFYALNGVIAGCSFAASFLKVHILEDFSNLRFSEGVHLDQYIDDSGVSAVGSVSQATQVIDGLKSASAQLFSAIEHDRLQPAMGKRRLAGGAYHRDELVGPSSGPPGLIHWRVQALRQRYRTSSFVQRFFLCSDVWCDKYQSDRKQPLQVGYGSFQGAPALNSSEKIFRGKYHETSFPPMRLEQSCKCAYVDSPVQANRDRFVNFTGEEPGERSYEDARYCSAIFRQSPLAVAREGRRLVPLAALFSRRCDGGPRLWGDFWQQHGIRDGPVLKENAELFGPNHEEILSLATVFKYLYEHCIEKDIEVRTETRCGGMASEPAPQWPGAASASAEPPGDGRAQCEVVDISTGALTGELGHDQREYWAQRCLGEVMSGETSLHQRLEQLRAGLDARLREAADDAQARATDLRAELHAEVAALVGRLGAQLGARLQDPSAAAAAPAAAAEASASSAAVQVLRDEVVGVRADQVRLLQEVAAVVEAAEQHWDPVRRETARLGAELQELAARHGATAPHLQVLAGRLQDAERRLALLEAGSPRGQEESGARCSRRAEGGLGGQLEQLCAALPGARDASSVEGLGIELARCIGGLDTELRVDMERRIDALFRQLRAEVDADVAARATSTDAAVRSVEARLEAKLSHATEDLGARAAQAEAQLSALQSSLAAGASSGQEAPPAPESQAEVLEKALRRLDGVSSQVSAIGGRVQALEDSRADARLAVLERDLRDTSSTMRCLQELAAASRAAPARAAPAAGEDSKPWLADVRRLLAGAPPTPSRPGRSASPVRGPASSGLPQELQHSLKGLVTAVHHTLSMDQPDALGHSGRSWPSGSATHVDSLPGLRAAQAAQPELPHTRLVCSRPGADGLLSGSVTPSAPKAEPVGWRGERGPAAWCSARAAHGAPSAGSSATTTACGDGNSGAQSIHSFAAPPTVFAREPATTPAPGVLAAGPRTASPVRMAPPPASAGTHMAAELESPMSRRRAIPVECEQSGMPSAPDRAAVERARQLSSPQPSARSTAPATPLGAAPQGAGAQQEIRRLRAETVGLREGAAGARVSVLRDMEARAHQALLQLQCAGPGGTEIVPVSSFGAALVSGAAWAGGSARRQPQEVPVVVTNGASLAGGAQAAQLAEPAASARHSSPMAARVRVASETRGLRVASTPVAGGQARAREPTGSAPPARPRGACCGSGALLGPGLHELPRPRAPHTHLGSDERVSTNEMGRAWFSHYAGVVVRAQLGLLLRYGLSLEAHGQNTCLEFQEDGSLGRLICQELGGGAFWDPERLAALPAVDFRREVYARDDILEPFDKCVAVVRHTMLRLHLLPLAGEAAAFFELAEADLRRAVESTVRGAPGSAWAAQWAEDTLPADAYSRYAAAAVDGLLRPSGALKALLRMRLMQTKGEIYVEESCGGPAGR